MSIPPSVLMVSRVTSVDGACRSVIRSSPDSVEMRTSLIEANSVFKLMAVGSPEKWITPATSNRATMPPN